MTEQAWMELRELLGLVYDGTQDDVDRGEQYSTQAAVIEDEPAVSASEATREESQEFVHMPELDLSRLSTDELHELANALVPQNEDDARSTWAGHATVTEWRRVAEQARKTPTPVP